MARRDCIQGVRRSGVLHSEHMTTSATSLILYSDSCGGQNRNINLSCLWLYIVANPNYPFTTIDQKFMMVGHSYLPNDRDFGGIETAQRKQQNVFVPAEWQELVRTARSKNPFSVTEMMTADFVSLAELKHTIVNWKKNTDKDKVEWLRIRWIHVSQEKQLQLQY